MNDTVVVKNSFGGRIKNSLLAIPFGILFILIGIIMLVLNEKNVVKDIRNVAELRDKYIDVASDTINEQNEGKLIVTSGEFDFNNETISDSSFGISLITPLLERKVEMYQWVENKTSDNSQTTYNYEKEWNAQLVKSSDFYEQTGHSNPTSMPYEASTKYARVFKVGQFTLSDTYNDYLKADNKLTNFEDAYLPYGYKVNGNYITNSEDISNPQVGDIRISFAYADYDQVTVLGQQSGDKIVSYTTAKNSQISLLEKGQLSGNEMINIIEHNNKVFKWILRLLGFMLIVFGIYMLVGPITNIMSSVPLLGGAVNGILFLAALLLGTVISLVVIGISWIAFRPMLGILLIAGAIIFAILFKKVVKKSN